MSGIPAKFFSVIIITLLYGTIKLRANVDAVCTIPNSNQQFQDTLVSANVFFRHGDRSPLFDFPNNMVNITKEWPEGYGQITKLGKRQGFELGQFLRSRYSSLIRDYYHPDDVYMLTSDYDRTIVTALSVLGGLYPVKEKWHPELQWNIVPIRTIPHEIDNIIAFAAPCPKYHKELDCYRFHGTGRMIDANHRDFYAYLANHTGIPLSNFNFEKIAEVYDTLYVQSLHKFGVPQWAETRAIENQENYLMRKIAEYTFSALTHNSITMQLRGGPLLRELMRNFEAHIQNTEPKNNRKKFKLRLYSGHDSTIATILQVFGVYKYQMVPYTGTAMIELYKRSYKLQDIAEEHRRASEIYFIKFFYRSCHTENFATQIPIPDCQDITESPDSNPNFKPGCSIARLRQVKRHISTGDWDKLCKTGYGCGCSKCFNFKEKGSNFSNFEYDGSVSSIIKWLRGMI